MRRPLCLLCLAAAFFLLLQSSAENPKRMAALDQVQERLTEAASGGTLTLCGTVADCSMTADGVRLKLDHLVFYNTASGKETDAAETGIQIRDFSQNSILTKRNTTAAVEVCDTAEAVTAGRTKQTISAGNAAAVAVGSAVQTMMSYDTAKTVPARTESENAETLKENLWVYADTEEDRYSPGDRLLVCGDYAAFGAASNPGQFDARAYYFALDGVGAVYGAKLTLLREGGAGISRALYGVRKALRRSLLQILNEKDARTAAAVSLGEKSWMERAWKQIYQEGGIAHIIAISGLHITMVGMTLYRLLRFLGLPFAAAAVPCAAAAFAYTLMTGCGISAVRAGLMFGLWLGAQVCGRKNDAHTSVSVAALLILLQNASNAQGASFALSFAAVLSLAVLLPALREACPFGREKRKEKGVRKTPFWSRAAKSVWMTLSGSLAVWLGTLPLTLAFFYQAAPWSILVNLAVVPLMSAVMASAFAAAAAGLLCVPLGMFLAAPLHYLLLLFEGLCSLEQKLPLAVWVAGKPALWRILAYYAILLAVLLGLGLSGRKKIRADGTEHSVVSIRKGSCKNRSGSRSVWLPALIWLAAGIFCILLMAVRVPGGLSVTCLDVGQGDGALLQLPDGTACLIDGGSSSVSGLWEYRIGQTVKYYGVSTLDYVFLSHADSDHTSGILEYLESYVPEPYGNAHGITLKNLVLPPAADAEDFRELRLLAAQNGIAVLQMEAGDAVGNAESGWSLTCLAPAQESLSGDKNEDSMVLRLKYGSFRMLFTGDLEGEAELALAVSGADLRCDVLKVGHHGSKNASSDAFLQAVQPAAAVISCGKNNRYGHPAPAAVARLENAGAALYCTTEYGAVRIRSDGKTYRLSGYLQ